MSPVAPLWDANDFQPHSKIATAMPIRTNWYFVALPIDTHHILWFTLYSIERIVVLCTNLNDSWHLCTIMNYC
jgi:hypothetical protein